MKGAKFLCKSGILLLLIIVILSAFIFCACNEDDDNDNLPQYFATFVLNNGENDIIIANGEAIPSITRDGHVFIGWYLDDEFLTPITFDNDILSIDEDITVYARWLKEFNLDGVFGDYTIDYDGEAHTIPIGELPEGTSVDYVGEYEYTLPGNYLITITLIKDGYQTATISATLNIRALQFENIGFEDDTVIYNGETHTITPSNIPEGANIEYIGESHFVNAGEYAINIEISKVGHSTINMSATLIIEKADANDITFKDVSVIYDGNEHCVIASNLPSGISVEYTNNNKIAVGVYQVIATFDGGNNYNTPSPMSATLTIYDTQYTLLFIDGDGEEYSFEVPTGTKLDEIPTPYQKLGYVGAWSIDCSGEVYCDITTEAQYTPIMYNVTYYFNGGNGVASVKQFTIEDDVVLLWDISRRGYDFDGWYTNSQFEGDPITSWQKGEVTNHLHLYAKWNAIEYNITYDYNADRVTADSNAPTKYSMETGIVTLIAPTRSGYIFMGWIDVATGQLVEYIDPEVQEGDINLKATWQQI